MLRFPKSANPSVSQDQTVTEQSFAMTQNTLSTYVNSPDAPTVCGMCNPYHEYL